ncbi:MAG: hypothetical protein HY362_02985 [Candidatus Aenigmarchaeota archaeon]|nr:hypothetical protein [Candidatus Aenigmarchaeota archaeon]
MVQFEERVLEPPFKPSFVNSLIELDRRVKSGQEKVHRNKKISDLL